MTDSASKSHWGPKPCRVVLPYAGLTLFLLVLIWSFVYVWITDDRSAEIRSAEGSTANLARLVEEHTLRTMKEADQALQFIISNYRSREGLADLRQLVENGTIVSDIYNQFSIIDAQGMLYASTHPFKPFNLGDREHFLVHVKRDTGQLFISKPVVGRVSGKLSIQLSRRINRPDGSFGGVAVASIDPSYFNAFYSEVSLGKNSFIAIAGSDGIVRAAMPEPGRTGGQAANRPSQIADGTENADASRIVRTRTLTQYPLSVSVGVSIDEVLRDYRERKRNHVIVGMLVSAIVFTLVIFLTVAARRQQITGFALTKRNQELKRAADHATRLVAIIESAGEAIISHDQGGVVLSWNAGAERLFGATAEMAIGKTMQVLLLPRLPRQDPDAESVDGLSGDRSTVDEVTYVNRHGQSYYLSAKSSPIYDASGWQCATSIIFHDITSRKHTERALHTLAAKLEQKVSERTVALKSSNEQLQAFVYSVSHDLRAPLLVIDELAKALAEDNRHLDTASSGLLKQIQVRAKRMMEMIDSQLRLSRLNEIQINAEPQNADALVRDVTQEIQAQYPTVRFVAYPLGAVHADVTLLRQVWINLIGNAAKFASASDSPVIEIARKQVDGESIFFVKDNGVGFDMKCAGRLFELFQRLHRQDQVPGTGAGLAIVKRIVERHGGRVWAEAKPGEGAIFYFTLGSRCPVDGKPDLPRGTIPLVAV